MARAQAGEAHAIETLRETGHFLGRGLATIVKAFDPRRIYVGGEITAVWDLIAPTVLETMRDDAVVRETGVTGDPHRLPRRAPAPARGRGSDRHARVRRRGRLLTWAAAHSSGSSRSPARCSPRRRERRPRSRSTAARSSTDTRWCSRASTSRRRCRWATASSRSPSTCRGCRPSPTPTTGRSRSARSRSGAGTPRPTRRAFASTASGSPSSRATAGASATPTSPATGARPRSSGCGRTPTGSTSAGSASGSRSRAGERRAPEDLTDVEQRLDLWNGSLRSRFRLEGELVEVETLCHPRLDLVAVRVVSPLLRLGRVAVRVRFPYGSPDTTAADWTKPEAHETRLVNAAPSQRRVSIDGSTATATTSLWPGDQQADSCDRRSHELVLEPAGRGRVRGGGRVLTPSDHAATAGLRRHAPRGARALERLLVERRGDRPLREPRPALARARAPDRPLAVPHRDPVRGALPAPGDAASPSTAGTGSSTWRCTGGTRRTSRCGAACPCSSAASATTRAILPKARATARRQGYAGARWPKMTDPSGTESPSSVGPFLVWQQPHPIYYAELVYRERPSTAPRSRGTGTWCSRQRSSWPRSRPGTGNAVRARAAPAGRAGDLPEGRDAQHGVRARLLALGTRDGPALAGAAGTRPRAALAEGARRSRAAAGARRPATSSPRPRPRATTTRAGRAITLRSPARSGCCPGEGVDREAMRRSLDWIWAHWSWPDTWGWDYPLRRDVRGPARRARPRRRRAAAGRAEERLPRERPQPPAARSHDLPAGERRAAWQPPR